MSTGKSVRSVEPPTWVLCMVIIFLNFQSSLHAVEEISHQSEIVPGMTLFTSAVNPRVSGSEIDSSAVSSSVAASPRDSGNVIDSSASVSTVSVNPRVSGSEILMGLTESTVSVNPRDSDGVMVKCLSVSTVSVNPRDSDSEIDRNSFWPPIARNVVVSAWLLYDVSIQPLLLATFETCIASINPS